MSLTLYRRHLESCPHKSKGMGYSLCSCPIWIRGILPSGESIRRTLNTCEEDEAVERLQRLERGEKAAGVKIGRTIQMCAEAFIADCSARNVRPSTIRSYRRTLALLSAFMRDTLDEISVDSLTRFRQSRRGRWSTPEDPQPAKPATIRKELETIRCFCAFCVDREWMSSNPAKKLKAPMSESLPTMPFTDDEVRELLAACDRLGEGKHADIDYYQQRARCMVLVLLYTGLRISDATALKRSSVNWNTRHVTLRTVKNRTPVKVQLKPEVIAELKRLAAPHPEYFFYSGSGLMSTAIGRFQYIVQRLGELAGIHAHPHRFRDTFARGVLEGGADMRTLQLLLGHKSIKTTENHYAQFLPSQQRILDAATASLDFGESAVRPVLIHTAKGGLRNAK